MYVCEVNNCSGFVKCFFCVGCSCETLISPTVERATAAGWDDKCRANNKPPTYFQDECEFGMKTSSGTHMLFSLQVHYM